MICLVEAFRVNSRNRYEERFANFLEFVGLCAFFTAPCAIATVLAQALEQERKGETLYSKCRAENR